MYINEMSTNQTTQFYKHGLGKCYVQIPLYLFVYLGTLLIHKYILEVSEKSY